jgi:hypothetical protein
MTGDGNLLFVASKWVMKVKVVGLKEQMVGI